MRKIIFLILFAFVFTTAGCSPIQTNSEPDASVSTISQPSATPEEATESTEPRSSYTENKNSNLHTLPASEVTMSSASNQDSDKPPVTDEKAPDTTAKPDTSQETNSTEKATSSDNDTPDTSTSVSEETPETEWTPKAYASAKDAEEVSTLVVKYINDYRAEQGTCTIVQLPGLTKYAEYRSVQLVSNYDHDTNDERAAATALKYGKYIDPSLYGISGEPYYTSEAREALAFSGKVGTVDEVAQHIATMMKNSSGHWAYVGGSEYIYVGVGITYESGYWYCDIAMSMVNNG